MSNITHKPIKPNKVDTSKISFSPLKSIGTTGAKLVYLNHGGDFAKLFVQSPEMKLPFDSGTYYPENEQSGKYAIKVAMDNIESNPSMKDFHDMLSKMDDFLIEKGIENASEWLGGEKWFKKKGEVADKVTDNYTRMCKVSMDENGEPNGKWAPSFAFKIVKRDGLVKADCYDSDKKELVTSGDECIDLSQMFKKGTKVKMIVSCNGLWISSVGWGCTWRGEQIQINTPVGFSGYAFDDSDEDEGVELSRTSSIAVRDEKHEQPDNYVEDSDEEGSGEEGSGEEDSGEEDVKVVKRKVKKGN